MESDKIKIMVAQPQDALGITNVLHKAWFDTYPNKDLGITIEDIEDKYKDAFTEDRIKSFQDRIINAPDNEKRIIAKSGEVIVGVAVMIRNEADTALRTIYVLPSFHRKGIGTKLWQEVKKFAIPGKDITVNVAVYNQKAINFYKKIGFEDTGKRWSDEKWKMKSGATIPEMQLVIRAKTHRYL